jgi:hypothetical protein
LNKTQIPFTAMDFDVFAPVPMLLVSSVSWVSCERQKPCPNFKNLFYFSFTVVCHWGYALPAETTDAEQLNTMALPLELAFCGDAFAGGRIHLALEHEVAVAQQIAGT